MRCPGLPTCMRRPGQLRTCMSREGGLRRHINTHSTAPGKGSDNRTARTRALHQRSISCRSSMPRRVISSALDPRLLVPGLAPRLEGLRHSPGGGSSSSSNSNSSYMASSRRTWHLSRPHRSRGRQYGPAPRAGCSNDRGVPWPGPEPTSGVLIAHQPPSQWQRSTSLLPTPGPAYQPGSVYTCPCQESGHP